MAKEGTTLDLEPSDSSHGHSHGQEGHVGHGQGLVGEDGDSETLMLAEGEGEGFWPVLRNRQFLVLWAGQIFSQLADKVFLVMAIALITTRFQQANQPISGWVSAVMIAFTIPAVLFGSLAGVYVDRWSKKKVLVLSNLVRGFFVLGIPHEASLCHRHCP